MIKLIWVVGTTLFYLYEGSNFSNCKNDAPQLRKIKSKKPAHGFRVIKLTKAANLALTYPNTL